MPKVLYIEDEPDIAELVRRWLEEEDYQFFHAGDGEIGLGLARTHRPDLILLDLNLGEFSPDGWEVNRRLKGEAVTREIPVVALTAHAQWAESRDRALRDGFVEHISKPFHYDLLIERVQAHLARGGAG